MQLTEKEDNEGQVIRMNVRKEIAANLKNIRKARKMNQAEAAEYLGLTQGLISQYEKGITVPSVDVLADYAVKFHVSLDYIFGFTESMLGGIMKPEIAEALSAGVASIYGNPDAPGVMDIDGLKRIIDAELKKKTDSE